MEPASRSGPPFEEAPCLPRLHRERAAVHPAGAVRPCADGYRSARDPLRKPVVWVSRTRVPGDD